MCTQIAVAGDFLFALDSGMRINVIKNGKLISRYDTSKLFHSEAVSDFTCKGNILSLEVELPEKRDSELFYFLIQQGGELAFLKKIASNSMIGKGTIEKVETKQSLNGYYSATINDNKTIEWKPKGCIIGIKYLGTLKSTQYRFFTYEIEEKNGTEYLIKRMYYVSDDGTVLKELLIPRQTNPVVIQIRTIGESSFLLNTQADYVEIINLDKAQNLLEQR